MDEVLGDEVQFGWFVHHARSRAGRQMRPTGGDQVDRSGRGRIDGGQSRVAVRCDALVDDVASALGITADERRDDDLALGGRPTVGRSQRA